MIKSVAVIFFSLFMFNFAFADLDAIPVIEKEWDDCLNAPGGESTYGTKMCNGDAYDKADFELNRVYKNIVASLKGKDSYSVETLRRLIAAERAWIQFRDTNCSLVGSQMLGGTGEGVLESGCAVQTTIDRVKELKSIFSPL